MIPSQISTHTNLMRTISGSKTYNPTQNNHVKKRFMVLSPISRRGRSGLVCKFLLHGFIERFADDFLQTSHHAALGEIDSCNAHAQLARRLRAGLTLHSGLPERLPR